MLIQSVWKKNSSDREGIRPNIGGIWNVLDNAK